jgi:hypothetical protein
VGKEREVDDEGFADDGLAGDEAPIAAVFAVVAVVAEDEIVAGGDDELAVVDEGAHLDPPDGVDVGVGALEAGEVVAKVVGRAGAVDGVGLGEGAAVDVDVLVVETGSWKTMTSPRWMAAGGSRVSKALGAPVCLSTRRKSPTRRVDSIDSEGMRKGWTQKVMIKVAMTMTEKSDWMAGRKPWVS